MIRQGWAQIDLGVDAAQLRQRFIAEARALGRIESKHLLPVRGSWIENGTAYFATPYFADAEPLDRRLRREGPMSETEALSVIRQMLDALRAVHLHGLLHRDVKPSNILLREDGTAYLIDFGAAREWGARAPHSQTIFFTPGFAPPEQLSERAPRTPASDLYSLSATAYAMLTGEVPSSAADRLGGLRLTPIRDLAPQVSAELAAAIERGLALAVHRRPQTVQEFLGSIEIAPSPRELESLASLDARLVRATHFTFPRRGCPACEGLLREVHPKRDDTCPCCSRGVIRLRKLNARLCPACKSSPLKLEVNDGPLAVCPQCSAGRLNRRKRGLLGAKFQADCPECHAHFEADGDQWTRTNPAPEVTQSARAWQQGSGRSEQVVFCSGCEVQFDVEPDGRWRPRGSRQALKFDVLYPEEWIHVAHGLEPGAGNAECDSCLSDYYLDDDTATLLNAEPALGPFAIEGLGVRLRRDDLPWRAAGKKVPEPGFVCDRCATEFSESGEFLKLAYTAKSKLEPYSGYTLPREDWHRIGAGLPMAGRENEIESKIPDAIRAAYIAGEIGFEGRPDLAWSGPAERLEPKGKGTLRWDRDGLTFGGLLRKERIGHTDIQAVDGANHVVRLQRPDGTEVSFWLEDAIMEVRLESGTYEIELNVHDLLARLALSTA